MDPDLRAGVALLPRGRWRARRRLGFLAPARASYTKGSVIRVDGGPIASI
jgi:hypothetical protein